MEIKFGKVFLHEGTKDDDPKRTTLKMLAGANVSNVDLKWYDNNGKLLHNSLYEDYTGRSVSLQFTFSAKDCKTEQDCTQLVTLLLPDKLGYFPEPNMDLLQDGPGIMSQLGYRSGYTQQDTEKTFKNDAGAAAAAAAAGSVALFGVGHEAGDLQIHTAIFQLFIWDDFLDKEYPPELKRYEQLSQIIDYMVDVVRGRKVFYNYNDMDMMSSQASIDVIEKHKGYFHLVREEALRAAKKWNCSPQPFMEEMEKYLKSLKLEACLEWNAKRNQGSEMFHRVQTANRELTAAIFVAIEAFALADGIVVEEYMRDSVLFQTFRRLAVEHVTKANDLVSFRKEYARGQVSNNLYLLHVEQGLSMEESLRRLQAELNSASVAMVETGDFLMSLHPGEEQLERFVKLGKAIVTGNVLWGSCSNRYSSTLVYDMIVH